MRSAQRGQAIAETVIFLPLFLLALFGIMWSVRAAVQYERVESAVRYAGLVSQHADPYTDYSLYSLYNQLGSTAVPTVTCVQPLADPLSDAAPTYTSAQTVTASPPFWSPTGYAPNCPSAGIIGIPAGTGLIQDVLLSQQEPGMTTTIAPPPILGGLLGSLTSSLANEHFFRPVGVNVILACYADLNAQIEHSLQYQTDTSSATVPAQLGATVTPIALSPSAGCMTF